MYDNLHFIVCENYLQDVKAVIPDSKKSDIIFHTYPAICDRMHSLLDNHHKINIRDYKKDNDNSFIIGCCCPYDLKDDEEKSWTCKHCIRPKICFETLLDLPLIEKFIADGYYLITPGWLRKWKFYVIDHWKFNKKTAKEFFSESAKKLLLLDTGVYDNVEDEIKAMSDYVGLPYETLNIGTDHIKLIIGRYIDAWEIQKYKKESDTIISDERKKTSEYVLAFDLLTEVINMFDETSVIEKTKELFNILYAPKKITYFSSDDFKSDEIVMDRDLFDFKDVAFIHNNDTGFSLKLLDKGDLIGVLIVENILFKKYIQNYLKLGMFIAPIIALSINNSHQYKILEKTKNDLYQAKQIADEAIATKDRFFSIVAHDLKNPVAAMIGYTYLITENFYDLDKKQILSYVQNINRDGNTLLGFLNNLLQWARSQSDRIIAEPDMYFLKEIMVEVLEIHRTQADNKQIEIREEIDPELKVYIDVDLFKTVLRNIISNSIKFTNRQGMIEISAKSENKKIILFIKDNGVGMNKTTLDNLFRIDKKGSRKGTENEKGTGLGLYISKEFIEKNNGSLKVKSQEGQGSEFVISIPSKP
ncbi:ATP-binding protein [Bacteroidota bacterium]